jgi:GNAT superfamily N-acetyltransferase
MSGASRTPATPARVRAIEPADVPRVWELLRELAEYEKLTGFLTGNAEMLGEALFGGGERLRGLVAERDGRLVGYALYFALFGSFRTRWRLWLEDLYVEPAERGQGTGKALMAELARLTRDGGFYALDWEVLDWNAPSIEFYERLGSRRIGSDWFRYRLDAEALERMADGATPEGSAKKRG